MRDLKFRAWNGERMQKVLALGLNEGFVSTNKLSSDIEDFNIMQYIGLTDKNGVEIYEGDILTSEEYPFQSDGEYNYHAIVDWIDEAAAFYLTKSLANKNKRGISDGISEPIDDISDFEVIGNVYENSNLISSNRRYSK